jgi:hypothetical protein
MGFSLSDPILFVIPLLTITLLPIPPTSLLSSVVGPELTPPKFQIFIESGAMWAIPAEFNSLKVKVFSGKPPKFPPR